MQINPLMLMSGNDIPFRQAQTVIHQPTMKEIGYIGDEILLRGCEYLNFSKNKLKEQDKNRLKHLDDFEILMTIMKENNPEVEKIKISIELVLLLLFPNYTLSFLPMSIMLSKKDENGILQKVLIDKNNFNNFKQIIKQILCLDYIFSNSVSEKYNPGGPQARAIVQKLKKRQQLLAKQKKGSTKDKSFSLFSNYISILTVGENKDMNTLLQYTVYQLLNEYRRFMLKQDFDLYIKASLAGAQDLEQVKNWMGDIYSDNL